MDLPTLFNKIHKDYRKIIASKLNNIVNIKAPIPLEDYSIDDALKLLGYCSIRMKLFSSLVETIQKALGTTVVFLPDEIKSLGVSIKEQHDKALQLSILRLERQE